MSTLLSPVSPQIQATVHFGQINELFPQLSEPHSSTIAYAMMLAHDPTLDERFCEQAGKVVHIIADLSQKIEQSVAIRGEKGPLRWDTDRPADDQGIVTNFFQRTFTFHIPADQRNDTISFKLVLSGRTPHETMRWQRGDNCTIDLSRYGHNVIVKVSDIAFS